MNTREALTKAREARVQELAALLGGHHYRDVLGDYEISPYYKHVAEAILAAGYKRERDHRAEQDELRKQVRG